jgi:hypothetical protein
VFQYSESLITVVLVRRSGFGQNVGPKVNVNRAFSTLRLNGENLGGTLEAVIVFLPQQFGESIGGGKSSDTRVLAVVYLNRRLEYGNDEVRWISIEGFIRDDSIIDSHDHQELDRQYLPQPAQSPPWSK